MEDLGWEGQFSESLARMVMSSCVPPPAQSRWPLPVCTRRRALAALSALEVFSPAHATAGGVDGAPVDAVVVVPGGRLVAANVHD
jgi:hypothetical protein